MLLALVYQTHLKAIFIDEAHAWWEGTFSKSIPEAWRSSLFFAKQWAFCSPNCYSSKHYTKGHIWTLGLFNTVTISESPNRNNIIYDVQVASEDVIVSFNWIIEELQSKGKVPQRL